MHLSGKRTPEGMEFVTSIGNISEGIFFALNDQYDCYFYRSHNRPHAYSIRYEFSVPVEYKNRWRAGTITVRNRDTKDLITTSTENANVQRSSTMGSNGALVGRMNVTFAFNSGDYNEVNKYSSQRSFLELYTDESKTVLERIIYTEQVNFEYVSTDPFVMNVERTDNNEYEDVVTLGYIVYDTGDACVNNVFESLDTINVSTLTTIHNAETYARQVALVPYSKANNSLNKGVIALLKHNNQYIISNSVEFNAPSTTLIQSVSEGDTFMLDNLWYKATTDLAVGDTLVVGTNCLAIDEPVIPTEELPTIPTTDGTYHLEVSVASGVPTMTWVANT